MEEPRFLTLDEVMLIHKRSLMEHGGSSGIRDPGGLDSAVHQPKNDFYYGHADEFGIAAAYAFHIAEAQAFLDGNKRTALGCAIAFLKTQGIRGRADQDRIYQAMIDIANHVLDKAGLASLFRELLASQQ